MKCHQIKRFVKQNIGSLVLILITATLITWMGVLRGQQPFRLIPLYVSLFIGMLQARANRYACLLGGINSLLYAVVYFSFGLYASAGYALFVSCPIQLATFIRWSKRAYKHSTEFRRMRVGQVFLLLSLFVGCFAILYAVMSLAGSSYRILDNTSTLLGIFTAILTLLSFREYTWLMLGSGVLTIVLDLTMMRDHPEQITYLIFSLYSFICIIRQLFAVRRLYQEQKNRKEVLYENDLS